MNRGPIIKSKNLFKCYKINQYNGQDSEVEGRQQGCWKSVIANCVQHSYIRDTNYNNTP